MKSLLLWLFSQSVFFVAVLVGTAATGQSIHALLIADVSPAAGWGRLQSHLAMDTTMVFASLHNQFPESRLHTTSLHIIEDDDSSPANILAALQNLKPTAEDIVFVYYTGHGGSDDRGQYFQLANGKLYRETLKTRMEALGARLNALITDCCNSRSDGEDFFAPAPFIEPPQSPSALFHSLFLKDAGWVDINACSPGEAAFFTADFEQREELPGSLFTKRFTSFLDQYQHQAVPWDQLVREVSLGVMADFKEQYPTGASSGKGMPVQHEQNVYALAYPRMPANEGPRTGLTVRDNPGGGALISTVGTGSPAARAFDMNSRSYVAIEPREVIVSCNGQLVKDAAHFVALIKDSPQIVRLQTRRGNSSNEYLVRLSY